LVVVL
jgi:hypothetical protein